LNTLLSMFAPHQSDMRAPLPQPLPQPQPAAAPMLISCVVPAFNEANNLPALLRLLVPMMQSLSSQWEIIVVDDGSTDHTTAALEPWLLTPGVRSVALSRNFGKEAALTAGLAHAQGQVVVMMDADGQHPVSLVPHMVAAWQGGADAVCALRNTRADESWLKRHGTALFYRMINAGSPMPIPADVGDFRLMDRRVVDALLALPERNRFFKGLYAWVGFRTEFIRYTPAPRASGRSSFSLARLMGLALTGLTAFSNLPLRIWSGLGAAVALCAMGYGGWIVVDHFFNGNPVPGWPTVVVSLMFFSGAQLLSIGILGEYVGRIFTEVKQRPLYLVRDERGQSCGGARSTPMQNLRQHYEPHPRTLR
jgi:polyisoprenyl-phosphate glycosyltransferase